MSVIGRVVRSSCRRGRSSRKTDATIYAISPLLSTTAGEGTLLYIHTTVVMLYSIIIIEKETLNVGL